MSFHRSFTTPTWLLFVSLIFGVSTLLYTVSLIANLKLARFPPPKPAPRLAQPPPSCEAPRQHKLQPIPTLLGPQLRRYFERHAEARAKLEKPPAPGSAPEGPGILVWQCPTKCPGLGDRMRGIRLAFFLALLSNRTLIIDAPSQPFPMEAALQPAMLDWTPPPWLRTSLDHRVERILTGAAISGENDTVLLDWHSAKRKGSVPVPLPDGGDMANLDDPDLGARIAGLPHTVVLRTAAADAFVIRLMSNPGFPTSLGASPFQRSAPLIRTIMKSLFKPAPMVARRVAKRRPRGGAPYTAVHLRAGAGVSEAAHPRFKRLQSALAIDRLAVSLARCVARGASRELAVVSDSPEHAGAFARAARAKGMYVHLVEGRKLHLSKQVAWNGMHRQAVCDGFIDLFADLWLLVGAETLVLSKSGFSKTGMLLGRSRKTIMYDIRRPERRRCVEADFMQRWWF